MSKFGTLVCTSREAKNLSFAELSQAIVKKGGKRISRAQLCMLESGARIPTLDLAYDIGRGLEVDLQTIVSAAFEDRIAHSYNREVKALEEFIKEHRLGKKLDVSRISPGMQDGSRA